jgi:hypothetical protein
VIPQQALEDGRQFLDPLMLGSGFAYVPGVAGSSSGGPFARAAYVKADRSLELHFRYALMAVYRIGEAELSHNDYMKLKRVWADSEYARFSRDNPLDGFRALSIDLQRFCSDFVSGDGEELRRLAFQRDNNDRGPIRPVSREAQWIRRAW